MVSQFVTALERPVSRVHLEHYRNGGSDLEMVVNYFYGAFGSPLPYSPGV